MNSYLNKILILFIIFIASIVLFYKQNKLPEYKILKAIEADTYFIDINKNNLIDENELFTLYDIVAFKPTLNKNAVFFCKQNNLAIEEYLKNGYLAQNWAKENLEGKNVKIKFIKNSKIEIYYKNENISEFLLKNGLAHTNRKINKQKFYSCLNIKQIKNNSKALSKLDFIVINLKNGVAHKPNCEYARKIKNAKLELKNKIKYFKPCNICYKETNQTFQYKIPKSKKQYKTSINATFDNIDIYLINPLQYKKPNKKCATNFCKRLVKEINNSTKTIDMALYDISEQEEIINALRNAKNREIKIRAIIDYTEKDINKIKNTSDFINEFQAKTDKSEKIMHNKFFIFDNKTVLTGSTNISTTGSGGYNSNIALFINDKELAKIYTSEFNQMYSGKFSNKKEVIPKQNLKNIKVYFSPKDKILEEEIIPSIRNAKNSIYISTFYLTEKNLIDELILAKKRGIEIYVILDATGAKNFSKFVFELRKNKIPTIIENWGGKNHEKTIMIDFQKIIIGSSNFSKNGFYKNDENIIILNNPQIAKFYADYFLYLFNSIDPNYLLSIPKAESPESINSCNDGIDNDHDGKIDSEEENCMIKNNEK